jgi:alkylation response protein AidB-like acyl-CoA dehydrogenase
MELTEEQRDLRDAVRGLLNRHTGQGEPGHEELLWQRLCGEIGVAGLGVPERYGGAGAGPVEVHIVMEELGRHLSPVPMLGSAVLAAQALLATGNHAACQRLLPAICGGTVAALAWTGPAGRWDPQYAACRAEPAPAPDTWRLTGEAHYVLDGDTADVLLVAAQVPAAALPPAALPATDLPATDLPGTDVPVTPDRIALFEVDPHAAGVTRHAAPAMDSTRRLATVRLTDTQGQLIGGSAASLARARDLAITALSGEQAGAARRALELTVAYTKDRVQFGRPIGSFQALQHRMADLHVLAESATSLSYAAAASASEPADTGLIAAAAKAHCSEALLTVAGGMIQLHGAIAITWEHPAHRYLKRARSSSQLFGSPGEHIARIAAAVIDG